MKKLLILLVGLFFLGLTVSAMAGVFVTGEISKDKEVNVNEEVNISKDVDIEVVVDVKAGKAAEADSLVNQKSKFNVVEGAADDGYDYNFRQAAIIFSINFNRGIVGVNQDAGNMSNQANVVSVAAALGDSEASAFTNAQAAAEQVSIFNGVVSNEDYLMGPHKMDKIMGSIIGNRGIVGVNQSVGNMNNQANQLALAVGEGAVVALSEADLGQFNAFNHVFEVGTVKLDSICGSIIGNRGVVGVNQSAGNMNNQANVVSISATVR
jgi:hypothetical protein